MMEDNPSGDESNYELVLQTMVNIGYDIDDDATYDTRTNWSVLGEDVSDRDKYVSIEYVGRLDIFKIRTSDLNKKYQTFDEAYTAMMRVALEVDA